MVQGTVMDKSFIFDAIVAVQDTGLLFDIWGSLINVGLSTLIAHNGKELTNLVRDYSVNLDRTASVTGVGRTGIGVMIFEADLPLGKKPGHLDEYETFVKNAGLSSFYGGVYAALRINKFHPATKAAVIVKGGDVGEKLLASSLVQAYSTYDDLDSLPKKVRRIMNNIST